VEGANAELKEALKGEDVDRIKRATETAMAAFQKIGQAMYAQQQASQASQAGQAAAGGGGSSEGASGGEAAAGGGASSSPDGDVVEGEIVDEGGAS
jgi:molecular chaperone DnaK